MTMDVIGTRTLRDLVDERALRYADKPFLVYESAQGQVEEFCYAEARRRILSAAAAFHEMGVRKNEAVVLLLGNSPEFVFSWLGLAWLGAIAVPANTASTAAELDHIIELSEAVGVATTPEQFSFVDTVVEHHGAVKHRVITHGHADDPSVSSMSDWWKSYPSPETALKGIDEVRSGDVAQLVFTSGTTARPKAVMLTHANYLRSGIREAWASGVGEDDRLLTALPLFHVNAQSNTVLAAMTVGGTCVLLAEYSARRFWAQVVSHRATHLSLVAMQVRTLLAQPARESDSRSLVRRNIYAINVSTEEKTEFETRYGLELVNGYGLSEAMTVVTAAPVYGEKRWPSIGLPAIDRQVRVVDDNGDDVPIGTVGQIIVHGEPGRTLMKGYFKDPDATADALRGNWLFTGDNGYFDEYGYLYFYDRGKDMIKRAGENISASEVEAVLAGHPEVEEAAVVGVPDPIRDEAVFAFVVRSPGSSVTAEDLMEYCARFLSRFKIPSVVEFADSMPKTSVGKIQKKALRGYAEGRVS